MRLFWTDSVVLSYSDVDAAKQWWATAFDCKEVAVPSEWDNPLPSDIALKFPGSEVPTVLLSNRSEGRNPSEHPVIFTNKLKKAHEHLRGRRVVTGAIHEEWGTEIFEITDFEGNVIEICNEP